MGLLMQLDTAQKRFEGLSVLSRNGKRVNGLFRLLSHRPLWEKGLKRISSNKGAETPGIDGVKFTQIGPANIEDSITSIFGGTYKPTPVRRVYIPKANGKLRPLGIPTVRDRLIQEVVRSILDEIYEPIFSDHSHGFRKGRSCHTALHGILSKWPGTKWLIEVDIKGYFDNMDHSVMLNLLRKRIDDEKFISLIESMLKAGYLEDWKFHDTYSGTPQGGIISPLLANIYLHELDMLMIGIIKNFNKGKTRSLKHDYKLVCYRIARTRKKLVLAQAANDAEEVSRLTSLIDALHKQQLSMPATDPMDPEFRRLRYVRYADDFLMGVIGSKEDCRQILKAVTAFLETELKLQISEEKSGIRNASDGSIFLGHSVQTCTSSKVIKTRSGKHRRVTMRRTMNSIIQLSVPRNKIVAFAKRQEYGHYELRYPLHRARFLHCDSSEIILAYNAEMRGFANFYSLAYDVKSKLNSLYFLWKGSLLKTFANKHKVSVSKVASRLRLGPARYGVVITVGKKVIERRLWRLAEIETKPIRYASMDAKPVIHSLMYNESGLERRFSAQECAECGETTGPFESHHVNHLRRKTPTGTLDKMLSARNRKTVSLCRKCHLSIHAGVLPDNRIQK